MLKCWCFGIFRVLECFRDVYVSWAGALRMFLSVVCLCVGGVVCMCVCVLGGCVSMYWVVGICLCMSVFWDGVMRVSLSVGSCVRRRCCCMCLCVCMLGGCVSVCWVVVIYLCVSVFWAGVLGVFFFTDCKKTGRVINENILRTFQPEIIAWTQLSIIGASG